MNNLDLHPSRRANKIAVIIRSAIYWVFLAISTIIWAWPILLSVIFPLKVRFKVMRVWPRFNLWTLRLICGVKYRIEGLDRIAEHDGGL